MTQPPPSSASGRLAQEIRRRLGPKPQQADWPRVSIVVPNRDGAPYLPRLLTGLIEHTDYDRLELMVIDNASSDQSLELLQRAEAPFPVSTVTNTHNASFSDACNQGAALASGKLLLFLNNDVEPFESGWLRELVTCLEQSAAGAVAATMLCPDSEHTKVFSHGYGVQHRGLVFTREDERAVPSLRGWEDDPLDQELGKDVECEAVAAACLLISAASLEEVGGFSSGYFYGCEDVDLCLKLRSAGRRAVCSGRSIVIHHPASTRRLAPFDEAHAAKLANRQVLWERWGHSLRCT